MDRIYLRIQNTPNLTSKFEVHSEGWEIIVQIYLVENERTRPPTDERTITAPPLALHFGAANEEAEARFLATPRRKHAAAEAEAKCLQRRTWSSLQRLSDFRLI